MKAAVVDASVAAKWVVEEANSDKAALLLSYDALHAPDHWLAEAVNVLWAKVSAGDLTMSDAEERTAILLRAPINGAPLDALMPRAFAIATAARVTVYDALYVALAERLKIDLVTADERLIRRLVSEQGVAAQVTWVGDVAV